MLCSIALFVTKNKANRVRFAVVGRPGAARCSGFRGFRAAPLGLVLRQSPAELTDLCSDALLDGRLGEFGLLVGSSRTSGGLLGGSFLLVKGSQFVRHVYLLSWDTMDGLFFIIPKKHKHVNICVFGGILFS